MTTKTNKTREMNVINNKGGNMKKRIFSIITLFTLVCLVTACAAKNTPISSNNGPISSVESSMDSTSEKEVPTGNNTSNSEPINSSSENSSESPMNIADSTSETISEEITETIDAKELDYFLSEHKNIEITNFKYTQLWEKAQGYFVSYLGTAEITYKKSESENNYFFIFTTNEEGYKYEKMKLPQDGKEIIAEGTDTNKTPEDTEVTFWYILYRD